MTLREADPGTDTDLSRGDEEERCETGPDRTWRSEAEVQISHADSIRSTDWGAATGKWSDLIHVLTHHQEQATKDGLCFVPGVLRGSARKNADVERLLLLVFDLDRGQRLGDVRQRLAGLGVEAVIYSTHSHLTTRSRVGIADYRRFTGQEDVEAELVVRYLAESKGLQPHVLDDVRVLDVDIDTGLIEVEHHPVEKYRVAILLAQPFPVRDLLCQGLSLQDIRSQWTSTYAAVGQYLGLVFDPACSDLARAYYFPSHAHGTECEAVHVPGRPLDLAPFLAAPAEEDCDSGKTGDGGRAANDHFVTDKEGCRQDLAKWDAENCTTCRIVDVIRAAAPGIVNELGDNTDDKQHIYCPFEHEHSKPDQGTGTFAGNPGRLVDGRVVRHFTVHCCHAACANRTRVDFLKGLIEGGHLTFADLNRPNEASQGRSNDRADGAAKYVKAWAFINAGGKVLLLNTDETALSQALLREADFERLHRHDYALTTDRHGDTRTTYWAKEFLKRPPPKTRFYRSGFCFKPGGNTDPHTFNLYRGLNIAAGQSGSCDHFRKLIFDVWAGGDADLGEWLWEYFLHMVARPGERVRTSVAIRGSQGAGKSIVFQMLRRIFRDMLLIVDNQNIVLGAYNESLIGKLAVVLEEAAFAGDRSAFQKMKNLITGDTVHINPKHKPPITVENYARVFVISNEEHFLHLEHGDRRYTVIEASDAWKRTNNYERVLDEWANGGAERFVWEALNHEFRTMPGTQTLRINGKFGTDDATDQVSQSRDVLQQVIVDLLIRGKFMSMKDGSSIAHEFYWPMDVEMGIGSVELQTLMRAVLNTLAVNRVEHLTSLKRIIAELERFCGRTEEHRPKMKDRATGLWHPAPTTRVLPPRRTALEHALSRHLITRDEYAAALWQPP